MAARPSLSHPQSAADFVDEQARLYVRLLHRHGRGHLRARLGELANELVESLRREGLLCDAHDNALSVVRNSDFHQAPHA
jgi:hypothetical protein